MRTIAAISIILLVGCPTERAHVPDCGRMPVAADLTPIERQVLVEAVQRAALTCGDDGQGCNFNVAFIHDEYYVVVQSAYDPIDLDCAQLKGGASIYLFNTNGKFTEMIPGM